MDQSYDKQNGAFYAVIALMVLKSVVLHLQAANKDTESRVARLLLFSKVIW